MSSVRGNTAKPILTFPEGHFWGWGGDGDFGEVVMACDMPEACKFLSRVNCQERFL